MLVAYPKASVGFPDGVEMPLIRGTSVPAQAHWHAHADAYALAHPWAYPGPSLPPTPGLLPVGPWRRYLAPAFTCH